MKKHGFITGIENWQKLDENDDEYKLMYLPVYKYHATASFVFVIISQNIDLLLNTLIFLDLYLTLTDPFKPRKRRCNYYIFVAIIFTIGNILAVIVSNRKHYERYKWIISIYHICAPITVFIPFILVVKRLHMKGISRNLRQKIVNRHIIYFVLYLYISSYNYIYLNIGQYKTLDYLW